MNPLIERLAREVGFDVSDGLIMPDDVDITAEVERFAALVASECARLCQQRADGYRHETDPWAAEHVSEAGLCRDAIRAAFPMPKE